MIFLDTNVAIALINGDRSLVRLKYKDAIARGETVALSSIVAFELWCGIACSQHRDKNRERLRRFFEGLIETIPFVDHDAMSAADIRQSLRAAGIPIGPYDVLIAGHALRHGATLVTANTREFERVPGLKLEDWTKP